MVFSSPQTGGWASRAEELARVVSCADTSSCPPQPCLSAACTAGEPEGGVSSTCEATNCVLRVPSSSSSPLSLATTTYHPVELGLGQVNWGNPTLQPREPCSFLSHSGVPRAHPPPGRTMKKLVHGPGLTSRKSHSASWPLSWPCPLPGVSPPSYKFSIKHGGRELDWARALTPVTSLHPSRNLVVLAGG